MTSKKPWGDSPKWGDRKIVKQQKGVVIIERDTIDFVVAYDKDTQAQQRLKYFTYLGRPRGEAFNLAKKEFNRRIK